MAGKFEKPRSRENRSSAAAPMERRRAPSRPAPTRPASEQRQSPTRPALEHRQGQNAPRSQEENKIPPRRPRRQRRRKSVLPIAGAAVALLLVLVVCLSVFGKKKSPSSDQPEQMETQEETQPLTVTARATIASQGDLLMHATIFGEKWDGNCYVGDGKYNFDSLFQYISPYTSKADFMVANLETTLGGDSFPYQGNPSFNCPDALLDSLTGAGYDMLLTANNHCYDTVMTGLKRTVEQVRKAGMTAVGTRLSSDEPRYAVVDVNGIQLGITCYTYTMVMDAGKPRLNNNSQVEQPELVNYFSTDNLPAFYSELESVCQQMKQDGAQATIVYIHWGTEYETTEDATQRAMAQKICDMGVDVIIGGHPHVVQPMDLLSSTTDPEHKTICIYSLGNAVSNQRIEEMNLKTGHTEDGVVFSVTFEEFSDGTVKVAEVDVLPTWVNKFTNANWKYEYNILPLDKAQQDQWTTQFNLTQEQYTNACKSYDRTMEILTPGLTKCQTYLSQSGEEQPQTEATTEATQAA